MVHLLLPIVKHPIIDADGCVAAVTLAHVYVCGVCRSGAWTDILQPALG
jgi:hypothetical protein